MPFDRNGSGSSWTVPEPIGAAKAAFPFSRLLDHLTDAVFCFDAQARFLYLNDAVCALTGFSQSELLSITVPEVVPDLSVSDWPTLWRSLKDQKTLTRPVQYQTKTGQAFSADLILIYTDYQGQEACSGLLRPQTGIGPSDGTRTATAAQNPEGIPEPLTLGMRELNQTEAELEQTLALLQATLESTANGILAVSRESSTLTFNQKFAQLWQLPDSVVLARDCDRARAFFENQVKNPEAFRRSVWEVPSDSDLESYELLELNDGRTFAQYAKPQRLGDKIVGRVWSIWDITDFKQAEAAPSTDEALAVRQAVEQSEQLSQVKSRFISIVCHQFRSLLNIISFSNSLLRRHTHRWTEEKKLPYLDHIQAAVEQINQLLDEVLLFGKSEVGKLQFQPKPLNLEIFCQELITQLQPISNGRQQAINFVSCGSCTAACVDPDLLQPILFNLLSNALKYSPEGSEIDVTLSCREEEVMFQIRDSGIGIPAADQKYLFEPFHRGSNVGEVAGTGLGLATVKNLVEIHGGHIEIMSEVGVGTTVRFSVPTTQADGLP